MTTQTNIDDDLHAYADGQLAPERAQAFEQALARDPALAARVAEIRAQNAWLRAGLDAVMDEPLPQRLIDAARPAAARSRVPHWIGAAAASVALLAVGVAGGWYARDAVLEHDGTPTTFARQAALTHALYAADVNRPVEVWAPEEKRLVAWVVARGVDVSRYRYRHVECQSRHRR